MCGIYEECLVLYMCCVCGIWYMVYGIVLYVFRVFALCVGFAVYMRCVRCMTGGLMFYVCYVCPVSVVSCV